MFYRVRRRVDGVHSCQTLQRALSTPSPRRLQVEPSLDAEIFTACRAAWDGPGATNALAVHAMAAHTMSLMIVLSMQDRDHSRLSPNHSWMQQLPWRCAIAATGTDSHVAASKCVAISTASSDSTPNR